MTTDPFAIYRPLLLDEVRRRVDAVPQHYAAVLRQHLDETESDGFLLPGLLCLLTAETFSPESAGAMPAASGLALLGAMAGIFETIPEDSEGVLRTWGLPRTLNAGDAFFALAQECVLDSESLSPERRLAATGLIDAAARAVCLSLYSGATGASSDPSALLSTAMALGALYADADDAAIARVQSYGSGSAQGGNGLAPDAEASLKAAFAYAREVWQ